MNRGATGQRCERRQKDDGQDEDDDSERPAGDSDYEARKTVTAITVSEMTFS